MIQIKLLDEKKNIVEEVKGEKEVNLTLRREYQEGDSLLFEIHGERLNFFSSNGISYT